MKKRVSLLLLFALALGLLSGCGAQAGVSPSPAPTETPELVWTSRFQPISVPENASLSHWILTETAAYAASFETLRKGEIPEGVVPDYEGQYDVKGYRIYRISPDGSAAPLAYESSPAPTDSDEHAQYSSHTDLEGLYTGPDGGLIVVEDAFESWLNDPQDPDSTQTRSHYILRRLDAEGNELSRTELDGDGSYLAFYSAEADSEGNLFVPGEQTLLVFPVEGEPLSIETGGWIFETVRLRDGRVALEMWDGSLRLFTVDVKAEALEPAAEPGAFPDLLIPGGGEYDYCFAEGTALRGGKLDQEAADPILNLLDCDLSVRELQALLPLPDGTLRGVFQENTEGAAPALFTLEQAPRGSDARTELTLGTLSTYYVSDAVLRFNRSQSDVRIRLRDYSEFVSGEDYEAGITKLLTEILAGDMPDLLALDNLPYAQLAAKGLLEDLYPLIDADPDMERGDYFPNVLKSMEAGGGLYEVTPGFSIITALGASEIVGDTPGWTYEDFTAALEKMPEGCQAFGPYMSREMLFETLCTLNFGSLIDWDAGTCDFESERFLRLLDFCAQFPAESELVIDEGSSDMIRIAEGQQMLLFTDLSWLEGAVYNAQYFSGPSTYIGLPVDEGVGNFLSPSGGFAMSARCADKQAAWSFLRRFLLEDEQLRCSEDGPGLPLRREAFQRALDKCMEVKYRTDENGNYLLDENGERIPAPKGGMRVSIGEDAVMEFELWAMMPEQADQIMRIVETAEKPVDMNPTLFALVRDEAAPFFSGQKSAADVARLIQSKASLYLSEQR